MDVITCNDLVKLMKGNEKIYIIDIRRHEQYVEGHLHNAVNIDENEFENIQDAESRLVKMLSALLDRGYRIVLYCERGNMSMLYAKKLMQYGVEVLSLYGGIEEYKKHLTYLSL